MKASPQQRKLGFTLIALIGLLFMSCPAWSIDDDRRADNPPPAQQSILIALLLDTSNSMDGLIDQAKSQLWRLVNELSHAKCDNSQKPKIKIALYEYGNDRLPSSENYIRLVNGLTDDLDVISEKLFSLSTNGGNEYCGAVINTSLQQLDWSSSDADLKLIFIAGNEPFNQGSVPFKEACNRANAKGIVINTIYCGDYNEGIYTSWKNGATITGGTYMNIDHNAKTVYVVTPYDDQLDVLNTRLNATYIYYGTSGVSKKELQLQQDSNADKYGKQNKVERAISKSSHVYDNGTWDLVDATKKDAKVLDKVDAATLPDEMKNMTAQQRRTYVDEKSKERAAIQNEIQALSTKRSEYIVANASKNGQETMLDAVMLKSVKEKAKTKKMTWEK